MTICRQLLATEEDRQQGEKLLFEAFGLRTQDLVWGLKGRPRKYVGSGAAD